MYFSQSFPCMYVGLNVRVEHERLVKNSEVHDLLATSLQVDNPRKAMWQVHVGRWRVKCYDGFRESFRNLANSQVTHCLDDFKVCFPNFFTHYISPYYPRNCKNTFRKKTLEIHLRVRDCKPTIIYTISLSFPLLLPLQL